ncbi:MAG: GNAT family N-acetyltransferase [Clostridiales bacterium]
MDKIVIKSESPFNRDSKMLMNELSYILETITGSSGRSSFDSNDVIVSRSLFVIARNDLDEAIGCGAYRPINNEIAEIKRMYTKIKSHGVGSKILSYLELNANKMGYKKLWLETRVVNVNTVKFYKKRGYNEIVNYGKYKGKKDSICFEKNL